MAFCRKCGGQVDDSATSCPTCGEVRSPSPSPPPPLSSAPPAQPPPRPYSPAASPVSSQEVSGFLSSLFDFSFTSFITTKLIKLIYMLGMLVSAGLALFVAAAGFSMGTVVGLLTLIVVAPLMFLLSVIYFRVLLELVIVVFRMAEHMAEIARRGRGVA